MSWRPDYHVVKTGFLNLMDSTLNPLSRPPILSRTIPNDQNNLKIDAFQPCMSNPSLKLKLSQK